MEMKIKELFEIETNSGIVSGEEIATLIVNSRRGFVLKDIRINDDKDKIKFLFEKPEGFGRKCKDTKYTSGPWRSGKTCGSVISDTKIGVKGISQFEDESLKYYGGYLVAESIAPENIDLITAAPELLEALGMAVEWLTETQESRSIPQVNGQPGEWLQKANEAIGKAKGEGLNDQ